MLVGIDNQADPISYLQLGVNRGQMMRDRGLRDSQRESDSTAFQSPAGRLNHLLLAVRQLAQAIYLGALPSTAGQLITENRLSACLSYPDLPITNGQDSPPYISS